ncbi:3806_t:CDS:2 [Ambispora gerdemannii]|uniref:3806_t:CDS:1 n=1 Tax=Ambispora gerdemannii TaxID=144530 RepID=A0A9N9BI72_9GLOM|nr:3806_t:CDS:2 [Ambispora gerdemannii]
MRLTSTRHQSDFKEREGAFYDPSWSQLAVAFGTSYREARQIVASSPFQQQLASTQRQTLQLSTQSEPVRRSGRIAEMNKRSNERPSKPSLANASPNYSNTKICRCEHYCSETTTLSIYCS